MLPAVAHAGLGGSGQPFGKTRPVTIDPRTPLHHGDQGKHQPGEPDDTLLNPAATGGAGHRPEPRDGLGPPHAQPPDPIHNARRREHRHGQTNHQDEIQFTVTVQLHQQTHAHAREKKCPQPADQRVAVPPPAPHQIGDRQQTYPARAGKDNQRAADRGHRGRQRSRQPGAQHLLPDRQVRLPKSGQLKDVQRIETGIARPPRRHGREVNHRKPGAQPKANRHPPARKPSVAQPAPRRPKPERTN